MRTQLADYARAAILLIPTDPRDLPSARLRTIADAVEAFDGSTRPTPEAVTVAAVDGLLSVAAELMGDSTPPGSAELFDAIEAFLVANGRF